MERSLDLQNGTGRQNRILLLVEGVLQIHMVEREKRIVFFLILQATLLIMGALPSGSDFLPKTASSSHQPF